MEDHAHLSPDAAFQRGRLLQEQHRLKDAADCYKLAISLDADHAASYIMLALCWAESEETVAQAVDAARRAVSLEPDEGMPHSVLALAINAAAKDGQTTSIKEALSESEQAVALSPEDTFAHAVLARMHLRLRDPAKAENAARTALGLDMENTMAAEALSAALLLQRKDADNRGLVDYQLQRDPENDAAQAAAGWQALMEGDHRKANEHFMEALRLNPMNEGARSGLIESYRARSWFYNAFIRWTHWMNQFTEGKRVAIMIGGFVGYRILSGWLKTVSPFWSYVVAGLWLLLVLWSHLVRGVTTLLVAMDRFARQSLEKREFWEGVVVGGLVLLSLAALFVGPLLGVRFYGLAALILLMAAVANAAAFSNDHHLGRHVYTVVAAVAGLGAFYACFCIFGDLKLPFMVRAGNVSIYGGVALSWLRLLRVLYA